MSTPGQCTKLGKRRRPCHPRARFRARLSPTNLRPRNSALRSVVADPFSAGLRGAAGVKGHGSGTRPSKLACCRMPSAPPSTNGGRAAAAHARSATATAGLSTRPLLRQRSSTAASMPSSSLEARSGVGASTALLDRDGVGCPALPKRLVSRHRRAALQDVGQRAPGEP
jgi:hypothetical protein